MLCALLQSSGQQLDDESLQAFMCKAEAIVNSRPLTTDGLTTPSSQEPLTPNHLLTMKANILLPPPGDFKHADLHSRKRWRRVQHLTNKLWNRWNKDFFCPCKNVRYGTVSITTSRPTTLCCSRMTAFSAINGSSHGFQSPTRLGWSGTKMKITVANRSHDQLGQRVKFASMLEWPIQKLVLLVACESG